ncbi:MAG: metal-dependent hydrolase [Sphingorhabdus sp.]
MQRGKSVKNGEEAAKDAAKAAGLTPREFRQNGAATPRRHWLRGDPFGTAFFNALSAIFPQGEAFMVRSMAPWRGKMPPALDADLRKFVEQEAAHSREHDDMNQAIIRSGYDISKLEDVIGRLVNRFRGSSDITKLLATACTEHFTAIIAAEILENDAHLAGADEEQMPLWIWHAVEEVEHKAVAYDCFLVATKDWSAAKRWSIRTAMMLAITASFFINRTRGQVTLLRQDGYSRLGAFAGSVRFGFGKGGIGRNIMRPWARFLKPGFHPAATDDRHLITKGERVFAELQAAKAASEAGDGLGERRKKVRLPKAA